MIVSIDYAQFNCEHDLLNGIFNYCLIISELYHLCRINYKSRMWISSLYATDRKYYNCYLLMENYSCFVYFEIWRIIIFKQNNIKFYSFYISKNYNLYLFFFVKKTYWFSICAIMLGALNMIELTIDAILESLRSSIVSTSLTSLGFQRWITVRQFVSSNCIK